MEKNEIKKKKIVIAAGGTLGHVYPSIAIADELLKKGFEVYYITLFKNKSDKFLKYNDVCYCDIKGFNRKKLLNNIKRFLYNKREYRLIKRYILNISPDLLISFGASLGSVCCNIAVKNNIKTIIHEQNSIMGLGNKLVYKKVDYVFLTIPCEKEGVVIGNPQITKYYETGHNGCGDRILIVCGTNGADQINNFFVDNHNSFKDYKITLITGKRFYRENKKIIEKVNDENFQIIDFEENMLKLYRESKVVLCRSGATTLSELFGMRKLILTIPSPNVSDNHQYYNACYYNKIGVLEMIEEKDLSVENIKEKINYLLNNRNKYIENIIKTQDVYSAYRFVDEVIDIVGGV